MNDRAKHFNAYVVISTFGRALMEAFVPVIMLKSGYDLHGILFYYLLMNLISFIITYPLAVVSKRFDNRILATAAILAYIGMQFVLPSLDGSIEKNRDSRTTIRDLPTLLLAVAPFLYAACRAG